MTCLPLKTFKGEFHTCSSNSRASGLDSDFNLTNLTIWMRNPQKFLQSGRKGRISWYRCMCTDHCYGLNVSPACKYWKFNPHGSNVGGQHLKVEIWSTVGWRVIITEYICCINDFCLLFLFRPSTFCCGMTQQEGSCQMQFLDLRPASFQMVSP